MLGGGRQANQRLGGGRCSEYVEGVDAPPECSGTIACVVVSAMIVAILAWSVNMRITQFISKITISMIFTFCVGAHGVFADEIAHNNASTNNNLHRTPPHKTPRPSHT